MISKYWISWTSSKGMWLFSNDYRMMIVTDISVLNMHVTFVLCLFREKFAKNHFFFLVLSSKLQAYQTVSEYLISFSTAFSSAITLLETYVLYFLPDRKLATILPFASGSIVKAGGGVILPRAWFNLTRLLNKNTYCECDITSILIG